MATHIRRREFILGGAAAAWPLVAGAQQARKVMRVGFFGPGLTSPATIVPYQAFVARLRELGFNDGQNIVIEYRDLDDPRGPFVAAADLMRLQPDLIVALGPELALQAVVGASIAVPIVVIAINYDPIARGYVTSLAQPGGSITASSYSAVVITVPFAYVVMIGRPVGSAWRGAYLAETRAAVWAACSTRCPQAPRADHIRKQNGLC